MWIKFTHTSVTIFCYLSEHTKTILAYHIPQNENVENDQRGDGEHNVEHCVEPEIVNVYVPIIRSAKEFYYRYFSK